MKNSGFTLIELLVVIAIISLLSSVVMASLNSARTKAQEAAIKSTLQSIKTQAELAHSKTGDYSSVESEIAPMLAHINKNGGTAKFTSSNSIYLIFGSLPNPGYQNYAISVSLNSDPTKSWSISNSGSVSTWDKTDTRQNGTPGTQFMSWSLANSICKNSGGRLPTIEELKSYYDAHKQAFNLFPGSNHWSSTSVNGSPNSVFHTAGSGNITYNSTSGNSQNVRCIR